MKGFSNIDLIKLGRRLSWQDREWNLVIAWDKDLKARKTYEGIDRKMYAQYLQFLIIFVSNLTEEGSRENFQYSCDFFEKEIFILLGKKCLQNTVEFINFYANYKLLYKTWFWYFLTQRKSGVNRVKAVEAFYYRCKIFHVWPWLLFLEIREKSGKWRLPGKYRGKVRKSTDFRKIREMSGKLSHLRSTMN